MKVAFFILWGGFGAAPHPPLADLGSGYPLVVTYRPVGIRRAAQGFLSVAASSRSPAAILGTFSLYGCIDRAARPYHFYPSAENHEEKRT